MALITNTTAPIEINGQIHKILLTRVPKVIEKEFVARLKKASLELEEAQKVVIEAQEMLLEIEILTKAAEAAPLGLEKVKLYKDVLVARREYAKIAKTQYELPVLIERFNQEVEMVAKERFALLVCDKNEELTSILDKGYVSYVDVVSELNTAFEEAAKKKSPTLESGLVSKE